MTPQTDLEIKGSFAAHPCAELIAEIGQARLSGSLRLASDARKSVLYFKSGRVVFAVSNARSSRLFDILLRREKLSREDLAQVPSFENDLQLAVFLEEKGFLSKAECDRLFADQIEGIVVDVLSWSRGDWTFSSLVRIRDGLAYDVDTTRLLVDYGRCLSTESVLGRFRSLDESFSRSGVQDIGVALKPEEAFVLSRADEDSLSAENLVKMAAMSDSAALQLIYTLWLGGLLVRDRWNAAFSPGTLEAMRSARLELRQEAKIPLVAVAQPPPESPKEARQEASEPEPESVLSLDEYLARVENAKTHYDILGVDAKAEIAELKQAYFGLAKVFHPDKYHAVGGDTLARVQHAFTELAQAHETLKTPESRELYDYRMRKELAERERRAAAGVVGSDAINAEQGAENFERGFNLLMDEQIDAALPFLGRAVHFAPKNARYHAYYGKALSADKAQRHKAEAEMQSAVKLDPQNPTFRILLAEFFIEHNLIKRAEGELNRLLAIFPANREARAMLDGLRRSPKGG